MATTPQTSPLDTYLAAARTDPNAWIFALDAEREDLFHTAVARMVAAEGKLAKARVLVADLLSTVTATAS